MGESIQGERGWEHHHFLCWRPLFSAVLPALDYSSSLGLVSPLGLGGWRPWEVAGALTPWRVSWGWHRVVSSCQEPVMGQDGGPHVGPGPGGVPVSRGTSDYSLMETRLSQSNGVCENQSQWCAVCVLPVKGQRKGPQSQPRAGALAPLNGLCSPFGVSRGRAEPVQGGSGRPGSLEG